MSTDAATPSLPEQSDHDRLAAERVQKLNVVMSQLGYQQQGAGSSNMRPDTAALLTSKDVEALRQSVLQRPPDSYIFAGLRWLFRSVKSSLAASFAPPPQFQAAADRIDEENALKADNDNDQQQQQDQQHQHASQARQGDVMRISNEGREFKISLSDKDVATLHPKVREAREAVMELEKRTHETLDRVLKTRLKFLALPEGDPPCSVQMKTVADCYAQFAARKFEAAQYLEKQEQTPEVIRRQQMLKSGGKKSGSGGAVPMRDPRYADVPEELLASAQVLKLSTSVLACREVARELDKCTEEAGLQHVERNHKRS